MTILFQNRLLRYFFVYLLLITGFYALNPFLFSDASKDKTKEINAPKKEFLKILAVGDFVHPDNFESSEISNKLGKRKYRYVRPIIQEADIAFINLESPFTEIKPKIKKEYAFVSKPEELDHILWAGFNLFSLANNHMFDAGLEGTQETLRHLKEKTLLYNNNIPYAWAGAGLSAEEASAPAYINIKDKYKIAFLAYGNNDTIYNNIFEAKKAAKDIKSLKENNLIIVSIHDGEEYTHWPRKKYRNAYRKVIDAGADIVFGHHPHVVQGIERYKHGVIFYSLGNFSMGTLHPENYKEYLFSIIALIKCELNETITPVSVEILPLYVDNKQAMTFGEESFDLRQFIPIVPNEPFASFILEKIIKRSKEIKGNQTIYKIENSRIKINIK
ncbi:MAG: CapA family protein [Spirochaetia bacterium]|nr:CapA family protein [Spirochaetia bacterium]